MAEFETHKPGTFSWVDLATKNLAEAREFYSGLFGWQMSEGKDGSSYNYLMALQDGKFVCGLGEYPDTMSDAPPAWNAYITCDDADAWVAKAQELGGSVHMPPMDISDAGRMAMLQDPTGAVFGIWQPKAHQGIQLGNVPNSLCWNELATRDVDAAQKFYEGLCQWNSSTKPMGPTSYTSFFNGEQQPMGGMLAMTDEWGDIPPHWMTYFAVEDCDAIVKKAQDLGATLKVPATDIPEVGRFAVLSDPQGAAFSVITMADAS